MIGQIDERVIPVDERVERPTFMYWGIDAHPESIRYVTVDVATGRKVSELTGHKIRWADADLGLYCHLKGVADDGKAIFELVRADIRIENGISLINK